MADDHPGAAGTVTVPGLTALLDAVLQELRFDAGATPTICVLGDPGGHGTLRVAQRLPSAAITLIGPETGGPGGAGDALALLQPGPEIRDGDPLRARLPKPADAVIVLFAAHRMADAQKIDLYSRTYQSLRPGGVLVHATKLAGEDEVLQRRQHWAWLAALRAAGADEAAIAQALDGAAAEQLSPLSTHLDWMRRIGFAHVDCGYRRGAFGVLSGEMPLDPQARPRNLFSVERMLKRG